MLQRSSAIPLLCLALSLGGCATMMNPGGVQTVADAPAGWSGRVMEFTIYQMPRAARLWVNEAPIDLSKVRRGTSVFADDAYDFKVLVPQDQPVTIRIQDGARVGVLRVQARFHARWIWFNGFLGPAVPIGWIVDARTKKWTYVRDNAISAPQLLTAGTLEPRP